MKKIALCFLSITVMNCVSEAAASKQVNIKGAKFVVPTVVGKANVYMPEVGEVVYDSTDATFWGYDQTSTWVPVSGVSGGSVPVGTILSFGGASAPTGYLVADGSAVSRTVYANLFTSIGISFGAGDGSTTFNLPDLRGQFLRGVDGSANVDPDKASRIAMATGGNSGNNVGSVQPEATKKNGLSLNDPGHAHATGFLSGRQTSGGGENIGHASVNNLVNTFASTTGITLNGGDNETRPVNAYVNFVIKY